MIELPVINCLKCWSRINNINLHEVLNNFIQPKKSSQKKFCKDCNEDVKFSRTRKIYSTPNCLILYLNNYVDGYYNNIKLKPPENLDMSKYMSGTNQSGKFSLVGAIEYLGTGKRGHYIAECYNFIQNDKKWYLFNDEITEETEVDDIDSPIILFYEKN